MTPWPLPGGDDSPWIRIPVLVAWGLFLLLLLAVLAGGKSLLVVAMALALFSVVSWALLVLFRRDSRWPWRAVAVLALAACVPLSFTEGDHRCMGCGSEEHARRLGWGIQEDWIELADFGCVVPSRAYEDFFDAGHRHRWLGHGHVGGAFILNSPVTHWSIYCGMWLRNPFLERYEESGAFRALVKGKVEAGEVTAVEVRTLVGLPRFPRRRGSVPPGTHALVKRAGGWLGEPIWPPEKEKDWPPEEGAAR